MGNIDFKNTYDALAAILPSTQEDDLLFFTTGFISRYAANIISKDSYTGSRKAFFMCGSMGHLLPIAIGNLMVTDKRVFVFDGDGSFSMSATALPLLDLVRNKPLYHFILDNGAYESTGNQSLESLSYENYEQFYSVVTTDHASLLNFPFNSCMPILIPVKCGTGKISFARVDKALDTTFSEIYKKMQVN